MPAALMPATLIRSGAAEEDPASGSGSSLSREGSAETWDSDSEAARPGRSAPGPAELPACSFLSCSLPPPRK